MDSHGIMEYSFELDAKITLAEAVVTMLEYFFLSLQVLRVSRQFQEVPFRSDITVSMCASLQET